MGRRARTGNHSGDTPPSRRRRKKRGKALALTVTLSLLVLLAAGGGYLYMRLNGDITTFQADGISAHRPAASTGGSSNVLLIGSDSRSGANKSLGGGKDPVGRSDTTLLLHVYADHKHAVAVSIPRDTLVDIPSCRLPNGSWTSPQSDTMFNAAFSVGGTAKGNPACTQNTVEKLTGLRVDHTMVVDFSGFAKMTEAVHGVPVCVPNNVYEGDLNPNRGSRGALVFPKGEQTVSGQKALDYVRIRHGIGDGSDIGRIQRQQAFLSSLIKKVKGEGLNPTTLLPLAEAATKSMTVDPGLGSAQKLISFALSMKDVDLHNTKFVTAPWKYQGARVALQQPDADELFAALKADRTLDGKSAAGSSKHKKASPSPSPSASADGAGISVAVANGTRVTGLAAKAAQSLTQNGFTVTGTTTAPDQGDSSTIVTYGPGEESQARTVAGHFSGARLQQGAQAGVTVTLGQSYADAPDAGSKPASDKVPSSVSSKARSADESLCSHLSYG